MENNLLYLRKNSKTTKKMLAFFLNVSVYTYTGYENNRLTIPPEVVSMLIMLFNLPKNAFFEQIENNIEANNQIKSLSNLTEQEKEKLFIFRLTGKSYEKISYHQINTIKKHLRQTMES